MAAFIFRGRSLRSRRKSRQDDEVIALDYCKGPVENLHEVLRNLVRRSATSKAKRLGYFNALVRLCHRYGTSHVETSYSKLEVLACLRLGFFHEAKEMRAACLRAFRYYIQQPEDVDALLQLNIHYLIARSLDICLDNEIERIHAVRLIRHLAHVVPSSFPQELLPPLVAIVSDGAKESDKMLSICLATLCELAFTSTQAVSDVGGISAILRSILDASQMPRINESLLSTILFLLNHPRTRHFIKAEIDLEQMLAPFTDNHYHRPEGEPTKDQAFLEEREHRFTACKLAITSCLRSWPGIIRLCRPDGSGLQSLLGALYLPHMDTKKEIMDIFYNVFCLPVPKWTSNFSEALLSVDASVMRDSWRLVEGFVAEEGLYILPHLAKTRSNLIDNHHSLLLATLTSAGLFEALAEVITNSDDKTSVRAIILLGELLHKANSIIPVDCNRYCLYLPSLVSLASSFQVPAQKRNRASLALSCLSRMHVLKKRGVVPCSLFLDHLLQSVTQRSSEEASRPLKVTRDRLLNSLNKENEHDVINQAIRDSQVLLTKDNVNWDWHLLCSLLKWPDENLHRLDDQLVQRFLRRLIFFYKPTNKLFAAVELSRSEHVLMGCTGMHLVDFLLNCNNDDASKFLSEWLSDIASCLREVKESRSSLDVLLSPGFLQHTCSQFYFLFLGRCSSSPAGEKLLESSGAYQIMLDLCSNSTHDVYVKLILSSLDYTKDGLSRLLLAKGLTSTTESARVYAVQWLHVLLRARVPFFSSWGLELLNSQLYDQSKAVSQEALSVLSEACEEEVNLMSLVRLQPSLLHLGEKGAMLLARFVSVPQGFKFLLDSGLLSTELEKWNQTFNCKYVHIVEDSLNEALTSYEKSQDGGYTRRSNATITPQRVSCYIPVHLYGQLVQTRKGFDLLRDQECVKDLMEVIRTGPLHTEDQIINVKAALWAVGHIGTSSMGIDLLRASGIVSEIIKIAEESGVFSVRGTAFFCLGLIASTRQGVAVLADYGWESVRRQHHQVWAVTEEDLEMDSVASLSASTVSLGSNTEPPGTYVTLPAVTVAQGSPRLTAKLPPGGSFQELNEQTLHANGDMPRGSPIHARSRSDPAPRPDENPVSLLRRPHIDVRDERSSSNESKTESFESSGVSSFDSQPPPLTTIPSSHSINGSVDSQPASHPSDLNRKLARLKQMPRRKFSSPVTIHFSPEERHTRCQPLTSPRDLAGYARLRQLKQCRALSVDLEADSSPSAPYLWEKMPKKKGSWLDISQLRPFSSKTNAPGRDLGSMDDLDAPLPPPTLLSASLPARQLSRCSLELTSSAQSPDAVSFEGSRSPSVANLRQLQRESENSGGSQDYVGISLPADVAILYQVNEEEDPRSQVQFTVCQPKEAADSALGTASESGLEHHSPSTCLACFRLHADETGEDQEDCAFLRPGDLISAGETWTSSGNKSRQSSMSETGNLPGSITSTTSIDSGAGMQGHMSEDSPLGISLIRKEALRLVVQLSSSVSTKSTEQGLLILKQRFPHAFQDACLYSEVSYLLLHFRFRLTARRFVQELFQDVAFDSLWIEPQNILGVSDVPQEESTTAENEEYVRLERVPETNA